MSGQVLDTVFRRVRTARRVSTFTSCARWKGVVLAVVGVLSNLDLYGQGFVSFANSASSGVSNCFDFRCPCQAVPLGTTFTVGLYYAPDGETEPSILLRPTAAIYPLAGRFFGGTRTTPASTPPGEYAMFQVRVWETRFGSTYEEAYSAPPQGGRLSLLGVSNLMRVRTGTASASLLPLQPISMCNYPGACRPVPPLAVIFCPVSASFCDVTNRVGTSVYFSAGWSSDTLVDGWLWFFNGAAVASMSGLYIPSVQFSNAGVYSLVVFNCYGSGSSQARLSVVAALNLRTDGSGTVEAEPNQATYDPYADVVVTASPAAGHELLKWSGDATGNTNPLAIIMDTNKTITAHFALKPRLEILGPSPMSGERLRLFGEPGAIYTVEQSENLEVWEPYLTVTNVTGKVDFDAPAITNRSRFFKAIRFP